MKRKKWWRSSRVSILVLLVLCSFGITNAEEEIHKVGLTNSSDNLVTYNGQASYSSGWSN